MSPERADATLPMADDAAHPGCNCGRRAAAPVEPLLQPDLVIAARDRAREPELPEATVARALAAPITPHLAKYDVIVLSGNGDSEYEERLIAEFARHEHRVIVLHDRPRSRRPPSAPSVTYVDLSTDGADPIFTLANLCREHTIEAAAVLMPATADPAFARYVRDRWGWRIVAVSGPEAPSGVMLSEAKHLGSMPKRSPEPGSFADAQDDTRTGSPGSTLVDAADLWVAFDAPEQKENGAVLALPPDLAWPAKWATLDTAIRQTWPLASIVVLTHDNLAFTRLCLASIFANSEYPHYELIVVDNASTDGTVDEIRRLAGAIPYLRLIENDFNAGFSAGNNQGLAAAGGDVLILLNNDTIVPRGWVTRLVRHLEDPRVGLVGPGTNRTCNEAQLNPPYQTYAEYQAVARDFGERHAGERYPLRMLAMFCLAFRRDTYERLGPLDERYEVGMFEDEDYALRAKAAWLDVVWTPEVYVHHAYHASIGRLLPSGEYMRLVNLNQRSFEEKWGICWERHRPLPASPASQ